MNGSLVVVYGRGEELVNGESGRGGKSDGNGELFRLGQIHDDGLVSHMGQKQVEKV